MMRGAVLQLSGLAGELKRRHVFRVALAYGAVAWVVLEVSSATFSPLGIPPWAHSLLAMLLILGFPVAMVLAWAYDITSAGVERTRDTTRRSPRPAARTVARHAAEDTAPLAIAALPFADLSPDGDYDFLADGIADELINGLARQHGLRVAGRTSSFSFGNRVPDVQRVGDQLGVEYVVEGSVRVAAGRLRVTAQLVETATGFAVWSGSYDRLVDDLLVVQEEVARSVLAALPAMLHGAETPAPLLRRTPDIQAYTEYLRGRQIWNERAPAALEQAIGHFRSAIREDSHFASAHAGMADCLGILVDYGVIAPTPALQQAAAAAQRALSLDPDAPEGYAADALIRQLSGDWAGAERGFSAALALDPAYVPAAQRLALLLAWLGRAEDATATIDAAGQVDPLSPVVAMSRGWVLYFAGQHAGAVAELTQLVDAYPDFAAAQVPLAQALLQLDRAADAVATLEVHLRTAVRTPGAVALHACALARAGDLAMAARRLTVLRRLARRRYVSPYHLAVAETGMGRHDEAMAMLEQARAQRVPQLVYLAAEPLFDPLRSDPRFAAILRQLPFQR